ncbi:MAG: N-6 DNA methylase [Gemmataceae bacterium]
MDLIEPVKWSSMQADVKGDIYEGLLAKSEPRVRREQGNTLRPANSSRPLWTACSRPPRTPSATRQLDGRVPAGGLRLRRQASGQHARPGPEAPPANEVREGLELVANTARLCIMNLYLHGIDAEPLPDPLGVDALASDPGERFSVVLTNPPFGKKSSIAVVNEAGDLEKDDTAYERQDFWTTTKNKQLNFVQQVKTLLKVNDAARLSFRTTCCLKVEQGRRCGGTF